MTVQQTCPRCGEDFSGDPEQVADAVVAHAMLRHQHSLDRHVVLAHLQGLRPEHLNP